jgi:hypothetical protein
MFNNAINLLIVKYYGIVNARCMVGFLLKIYSQTRCSTMDLSSIAVQS